MPYRRYNNYRRRYGRRRYNTRKRAPFSKKQYNAIRKAAYKQIISTAEKKTNDVQFNIDTVGLSPEFHDLTAIAAGATSATRIGLECNFDSLLYRFQLNLADGTNMFRMVIFQWFPDSGDHAPNWEDMFQFHTGGVPTTVTDIMSPLSMLEGDKGNFKVLKNRMFLLDSDDPQKLVQGYIKRVPRKKIRFATSSTEGSNHIFVMFISDSASITDPHVDGFTRVRFTDT